MTVADSNRIWIDGCFDFSHHGHAGAILQARRTIGDPQRGWLVCGVHNDEAITLNKGTKPVMNQWERYGHTRSNRWCSEVVEDAPYVTEPSWLDRYNCQYVVHGDDITLDANGENCYRVVIEQGRFLMVKRTEGVSTSEIIHRILGKSKPVDRTSLPTFDELQMFSSGYNGYEPHCYVFENDLKNVVVKGGYDFHSYDGRTKLITGDFDLFHVGHIEQLSQLQGPNHSYRLIVVVQLDEGSIMTLREIALSLLSCKYVDGILVKPSADFLKQYSDKFIPMQSTFDGHFGYLNKQIIMDRVLENKQTYTERNKRKGFE
ncbi:hypothetical protein ZYGR_0AD02210 [Zygosaccharomyces rouxii]|uniref:ethanolamine-phosphate cytidylyltransferase n=2 Tax=Zygosaccharomyces rouxii TaxID=4956 RepID=C5E0A5_ZYGRC|nr:uncharacterized protein ZYRO0G11088g [Zygosaccharomyces rouxii]KAH9202533.1 hypothetical protein LQ764DRAFT_207508 [Zygosaccharomyces rouxii]GAV51038.1 hypothetical protein ZYGR_0AD02210 [Zygosaccharomyces rouxii]CAR29539.1 ZYRO0G11088p [Zygosaccharomyces rouxii]